MQWCCCLGSRKPILSPLVLGEVWPCVGEGVPWGLQPSQAYLAPGNQGRFVLQLPGKALGWDQPGLEAGLSVQARIQW